MNKLFVMRIAVLSAALLMTAGSASRGAGQALKPGLVRSNASGGISSVAFSPDGALLAVGGDRRIRVLLASTGKTMTTIGGYSGVVTSVAFSPDGRTLAAAGGEPGRKGEVRLSDVSFLTRKTVKQPHLVLDGPTDAIYAVAFSPDGRRLAAASYDHDVTVWNIEAPGRRGKAQARSSKRQAASGNPKSNSQSPKSKSFHDHTDAVYALAFSPDGALLATAAGDRTVKVWDPESGKRLYTLSDATAEVYAVAFSPDGKHLAAGGADKALRTWTVSRSGGKLAKTAFAHEGAILRVVYAGPDTIVTSGEDLLVKQWDAATLQEKRVLPKQPDWPSSLAVSPKGALIAVGTHNGALTLYSPEGKAVRQPFAGHVIAASPADRKNVPVTSAIPGRRLGDQKQRRAPGTGGATLFTASLNAVSPVGVVRGKTVRLTLTGGLISDALGVYFDDPAITGRTVIPADPNRGVLRVDANVGPNARIGVHRCWVQSPFGTTGSVPFAVGAWPEVAQAEPNNTAETAQKVPMPCTIVGALDQPGDVDTFRIDARTGQEIVFEVVGQPLRSRIEPVVVVMDEAGNVLTESKKQIGRADTVLGYRFAKAGSYFVQLRDFEAAGGGDVHYRLNVGEFPLVTEVFPLGVQKRQTAEIRVQGFNLGGAQTVRVTGPTDTTWGRTMEVPVPGGFAISRGIAVGEDPEVIASQVNQTLETAQVLKVPVSVSARLASAGTVAAPSHPLAQFYRFRARKGEALTVDIQARRLGSPLDSEIEILDANGQRVERAVLRVVSQTDITFSDRDSASTGLRLTSWDSFKMKDYIQVGREVMRLDRLPKGPDEDVFFRSYRGQRLAYFGTTPEFHTVGAPVYKVEVHPAGSTFSPNGYPITRLAYRNDDGGPLYGKDSRLEFVAPEDGDYVARVSDTRGLQGDAFIYRLLIHPPRPDYRLTLSPEHPNVPAGGGAIVNVECERYDGFDGPIELTLTGLPPGVTATTALIEEGESSATMLLTAAPGAKTPASYPEPIRVVGRARIDGREVVRAIEPDNGSRLVTVLLPADIKVGTDKSAVVIRPGETTVVEAQVERQGKFGARVPIDVRNLPYGVWVKDVGLNGVLVTEQQDARKFSIYCEPWVKPQTRPFFVVGNVEGGTPNAAPPIMLSVEPVSTRKSALQSEKKPARVTKR